jgi:peptidoglycan/xylan/chitin deacetylase (PgdA/CDA1 family)
MATLSAQHVPATFFLTGDFASDNPASVRQLTAAGYRLGNHTTTHPHLPLLSDTGIVGQLTTARSKIMAAGGSDPKPLFRFPYGDTTAHTIRVVNGAGYVAVRWTVDTLGWKGTSGGITATTVVNRVVNGAKPGAIVLMHVGSNPDDHTTLDAAALPTVISRLRSLGYGFVTLDALFTGGA